MDQIKFVHEDVKEIKGMVVELVKQGAVHNQLLAQHERRSTNLEERFQPIEHVYIFAAKAAALIAVIGSVASLTYAIIRIISAIHSGL